MQDLGSWGMKWTKGLMYPFLLIAVLGFLLSLAAHIMSLCDQTIPSGLPVMDLHIGISLFDSRLFSWLAGCQAPRTEKTSGRLL